MLKDISIRAIGDTINDYDAAKASGVNFIVRLINKDSSVEWGFHFP